MTGLKTPVSILQRAEIRAQGISASFIDQSQNINKS